MMKESHSDNSSIFIIITISLIIFLLIFSIFLINKNKSSTNQTNMDNTTNNQTQDLPPMNLENRVVIMETNFGTLHIHTLDKVAPRTSENFIRLTDKGYFNGLIFHRIAKFPGFQIIQGGDPLGNGYGGSSIWGTKFNDEIYKIDTKEFIDTSLYPKFNDQAAIYKKGYLAMANSGPNTNGSQFFIMLDDTYLPPSYTIFAKISDSDFSVLEKIVNEVDTDDPRGDGSPNKEIKIIKATLE